MTKIKQRQVDKSYEIYLSFYQAVTGTEETQNIYKQFSPDFFDLIVIDECHRDKYGTAIPDRIYNQQDFDRTLVLEQRTKLIAAKIMEFLRSDDPYAKTIVFCEDTEHADRMRHALVNASGSLGADERVVTTSQLMTTGVD
jgi:type I site-specific restriction endonuclease